MEPVTILLVAALSLAFIFFTTKYTYWKRRNVPSPTPIPILGNYKNYYTYRKTFGETVQEIYQQFPDEPFVGAYYGTEPVFIPRDPEIIKTIMTKDFHYFSGRRLTEHEHRDNLAASSLVFAAGDKWKALRQSFNPMFSTAKLKSMFSLVTDCGKKMDTYLDRKYEQSEIQNVKEITTNFTLEVIGATIFGMDFSTLNDEKNQIRTFAYKLMEPKTWNFIKTSIRETWPNLYYGIMNIASGDAQGVEMFFFQLAQQSFGSRQNKPTGRNDLIDYLLKFKEQGFLEAEGLRKGDGEGNRIKMPATDMLLVSQILVFFVAGFETSASTLSLIMYELTKHPKVQQRLAEEIDEVLKRYNGEITYEAIQEMKYMEMVILETLRKYPVLGVITRECLKNYTFEEFNLKIEKGTRIHIAAWAIHHDPKHYPEPDKFDPERFSPEEAQKRHPYTNLVFGEGHRICIGLRFAKLQMSVALITTLRKFRLEQCSQTVDKPSFDPRSFTTASKEPLQLRLVRRS